LYTFSFIVGFLPELIDPLEGVILMFGLCKKPVVLSEEVYWWLVKRKFELRCHSIDEVLRIEMPQMSDEFPDHSFNQVKLYSFEGYERNGIKELSKK